MLARFAALLIGLFGLNVVAADVSQLRFGDKGYTTHGEWSTAVHVSPRGKWQPGDTVNVSAVLVISDNHLASLRDTAKIAADGFCMLVTAERTFDAEGRLRLASDERMSTLITPTGLPIEGGWQGAITARFGYGFRTPVDQFQTRKLAEAVQRNGEREVSFQVSETLPAGLPPGLYRVRVDFGVSVKTRYYDLTGGAFARRPFFKGRPTESHLYSPPIPADGTHVSGRKVEGAQIRPRVPWVLLANYNSNGYRGVVAEQDKANFGISGRNLIQDDVILPMYGEMNQKLAYSLEPQFPSDTIEARSNIPWNYTRGEMGVEITNPDGTVTDFGTWPFAGQAGQWPTTRRAALTAWRPPAYGAYTVQVGGWTEDVWGNRYIGGGTYKFWIAKRMTLATATFQGQAYPVGNRYGRDIAFSPAVPADVEVAATLFANSDPAQARTIQFAGKASPSGVFGAAQGNTPLVFDAPGEYAGNVLAKYWDKDGHLWVCSMRHAGVVYPPDTPIVAHGKMVSVKGKLVPRGETGFEGHMEENGEAHLDHINFPYNAGDVLLIASEGFGANKIEPVLSCDWKDKPSYDMRIQGIGLTNVRLTTSNKYSPHLFPEYVTDRCYYYGAAPRPGFMGRFLVAEDNTRAPYWPTSPNSFGGQINASANGDLPGDIYRLIGGVVLRRKGETPLYAGYVANAFLLPKGTNNNRVIAPGSEDLISAAGAKGRFFLVGTRPGMLYEVGTSFAPAAQIDPIVPAEVRFTLDFPDGRRDFVSAKGDAGGSFASSKRWTLDVPGIYRFQIEADWEGHRGVMPGLPPQGGEIYVVEKNRPRNVHGLEFDLPVESSFSPSGGLRVTGTSTAQNIHFAALIPGCVLDEGSIVVKNGRFEYFFDPKLMNYRAPTYDVANRNTGRPEIKDVVHLTFFSKERAPDGGDYHDFVRLILRGNRVSYTR
ncbi:MAG: hypothetical protein HY822_25375 [Acidobacteria bacterium]|nr:hypothetical protein [Acidobacteriota bacterium]